MRQRLGLATALLGDPEVLVLDEPANGLDPAGIRWLRDLLRSLAAEGRTVLVSSHVLSEVAQTADRVVIIHRGRLIQQAIGRGGACGCAGSDACPDAGRANVCASCSRGSGASVTDVDGALAVDLPPERVGELAAANGDRPPRADGRAARRSKRSSSSSPAGRRPSDGAHPLRVAEDQNHPELVGIPDRDRRARRGSLPPAQVGSRSRIRPQHRPTSSRSRRPDRDHGAARDHPRDHVVTTEFRHGTTTPTFLAAPHRERVIGAKTVAALLVAILFAVPGAARTAAVSLPWLAIVDATTQLGDADVSSAQVAEAFFAVVSGR